MQTASKPPSIEQYAAFILEDERVDRTLKKIEASNRMAEHFLSLPTDGTVSKEELVHAQNYRKVIAKTRERNVLEIIRKAMPERWFFLNDIRGIAHNVIAGEPGYDDLPLIMLWHFASTLEFRQFLVTGKLQWFNNVLPTERRLQFVFSLFLWLEMDAQYDVATRRAYYVTAQDDGMVKKSTVTSREKRLTSTITQRKRFIELFKDYIHTDVWTSDDYEKQGKQGTILRLRLTDSATGQFVIQECGQRISTCNTQFLANQPTIDEVVETYLKQGKLLRNSQEAAQQQDLTFQCHVCGNDGACHFKPMTEPILFYHMDCYCGK